MKISEEQQYIESGLSVKFFLRHDSSTDLKMSVAQQKYAILSVMHWLNDYQNIKELSIIGKNPIVRYNWAKDTFKTIATVESVRLDLQGKKPQCRYYLQQDDVKGKTNLVEIYLESELNRLMQLNDNPQQKKLSEKWRGRVQRAFKYFRNFIKENITEQASHTPCIRISLTS